MSTEASNQSATGNLDHHLCKLRGAATAMYLLLTSPPYVGHGLQHITANDRSIAGAFLRDGKPNEGLHDILKKLHDAARNHHVEHHPTENHGKLDLNVPETQAKTNKHYEPELAQACKQARNAQRAAATLLEEAIAVSTFVKELQDSHSRTKYARHDERQQKRPVPKRHLEGADTPGPRKKARRSEGNEGIDRNEAEGTHAQQPTNPEQRPVQDTSGSNQAYNAANSNSQVVPDSPPPPYRSPNHTTDAEQPQ